ncbi:unnamed protein product, partial [Ascophyllum nodosum]
MGLPFWVLSIPLGFLNVLWPRFYSVYLIYKAGVEIDLANPRTQTEGNEVSSKDTDGRITRAYSAHQNGWEAMSMFVAGALLAFVCGVQQSRISVTAAVWLTSRILYNVAYIIISNNKVAPLRSLIFFVGLCCSFAL